MVDKLVRARKKLGVSAPDFGALIEVAIAVSDSTNIAEHVPVTLLAQLAAVDMKVCRERDGPNGHVFVSPQEYAREEAIG